MREFLHEETVTTFVPEWNGSHGTKQEQGGGEHEEGI